LNVKSVKGAPWKRLAFSFVVRVHDFSFAYSPRWIEDIAADLSSQAEPFAVRIHVLSPSDSEKPS